MVPLLCCLLTLAVAAADLIPTTVETVKLSNGSSNPEPVERREEQLFEPIALRKWTRDRQFLRQLHEPLCRPRPVLVPVTPAAAAADAKFSPERVLVERCEGSCGTSLKSCVPTATSTARVPVMLLAPGRRATAGHVLVQRHDACACACATQPRHCTHRQEYVAGECRCRCRPQLQEEATRCDARDLFAWDEELCSCGCRRGPAALRERPCAPGRVWVPDICQCRPFLPPEFIEGTENIDHKLNRTFSIVTNPFLE